MIRADVASFYPAQGGRVSGTFQFLKRLHYGITGIDRGALSSGRHAESSKQAKSQTLD
jgi:hypothetical protein